MIWPQSRSTLFPYTTLFRSLFGDLLLAHQNEISQGQKSVTLQNYFGEASDVVTVPLDPRFDAVSNAQRYFNKYRKLRSEEHTSELQSHSDLVCRLLLEKKKK